MKVVAATDGSAHGRWAIEWLAQVPFNRPPVVQVIHVVDVAGVRAPFMFQPAMAGVERYLQAEVKRLEKDAKSTQKQSIELLRALKLTGTVTIEHGPVAPTLVKHAQRGTGLLSIGLRGLDALDRFMLGSASNHAIHHAACSVLVVKEAPRPVRRIVLAIDGSPASDKAVRFLLRELDPQPNGPDQEPVRMTVVHVMPFLKYPEVREAGQAVVRRYMDKAEKAGFDVQEAVRVGKPADEILTVAKQHKADLIVTGAKGLSAISRALLGSVSTRVVQYASCSVLVVR